MLVDPTIDPPPIENLLSELRDIAEVLRHAGSALEDLATVTSLDQDELSEVISMAAANVHDAQRIRDQIDDVLRAFRKGVL